MVSLIRFLFLAQSARGDSDFMSQLAGLVAFVCVLGAVWVGLMFFLWQRTAENRRRKREGLPPLTPIHVTIYNWARELTGSAPVPSSVSGRFDMPAPDLGMLTGDLPEPDLSAITGSVMPLDPPTPEFSAAELAEEFSLDLPEPEPAAEVETLPEAQEIEEEPAMPVPSANEPLDAVELLRVWRDLSDGSLIVEVAGHQFRAVTDIQDANVQRRFVSVMRDLNQMARAASSADQPAPKPKPQPSTAPAPASSQQPKPLAPKTPDLDDIDLSHQSLGLGTMLGGMTKVAMGHRPEPVESTPPPPTIAEQIEVFLQRRLANSPDYAGRSIHIRPSIAGGVRIEIDGKFYDGVGDVDDDAVRELLQAAVQEWESNQ